MSNLLSPTWEITIGSRKITDLKKNVISVVMEDSVNGSDTCTLILADVDSVFVSDNLFVDDTPVKVDILWSPGVRDLFEGFITALDIIFPESGIPEMTLFCLDKSHKMFVEEKSRTFSNTTRAEVVKTIAQEYGFSCVIEPDYNSKPGDFSQSNQTDIEFCEGLAQDEDCGGYWRAKLIGNTMYYTRYGLLTNPVATFDYKIGNHEIISFQPKLTKDTRKIQVPATPSKLSSGAGSGAGATDKNVYKVEFSNGAFKYNATLKDALNAVVQESKDSGFVPKIVDFTAPLDKRDLKDPNAPKLTILPKSGIQHATDLLSPFAKLPPPSQVKKVVPKTASAPVIKQYSLGRDGAITPINNKKTAVLPPKKQTTGGSSNSVN